jgi:hypothetical protein
MARSQTRKQRGGTLNQGKEFNQLHLTQHGGAATPIYGAPVGYTGELESGLRDSARLSQYDTYFKQASGMSDVGPAQKGGARKTRKTRKTRKGRKASKASKAKKSKASKAKASKAQASKAKKSKKSKKSTQRGGSRELGYGNVGDSYMILSPNTKTGGADFSNPLLKH